MPEFHRTKPSKIFNGKNMDVFIESDYPVECFDAPRSYVAYLTSTHEPKALASGNTASELLTELHRWDRNIAVYRLIKDDVGRYEKQIETEVV